MKMSTKGRYSLRIMVELAQRFGKGPVMVESIAGIQGISSAYIHLLANALKTAGLARSTRGPNGGYELTRSPETITALDVIRVTEGLAMVDCIEDSSLCERKDRCATRRLWVDVNSAIESVLGQVTLADLAMQETDLLGSSRKE